MAPSHMYQYQLHLHNFQLSHAYANSPKSTIVSDDTAVSYAASHRWAPSSSTALPAFSACTGTLNVSTRSIPFSTTRYTARKIFTVSGCVRLNLGTSWVPCRTLSTIGLVLFGCFSGVLTISTAEDTASLSCASESRWNLSGRRVR